MWLLLQFVLLRIAHLATVDLPLLLQNIQQSQRHTITAAQRQSGLAGTTPLPNPLVPASCSNIRRHTYVGRGSLPMTNMCMKSSNEPRNQKRKRRKTDSRERERERDADRQKEKEGDKEESAREADGRVHEGYHCARVLAALVLHSTLLHRQDVLPPTRLRSTVHVVHRAQSTSKAQRLRNTRLLSTRVQLCM